MTTIACDTNVLLDYGLKRPNGKNYRQLFLQAERGQCLIYISIPVLLECEWVLRSYYHQSKSAVIAFLQAVCELPSPYPEEIGLGRLAVDLYSKTSSVNFTDCIIVVLVHSRGVDEFMTADRKLAKLYRRLQTNT
ncbi:PIN domain-containing protein [Candidatus Berkelbacteria bacterium]|nr:PIN domain-containing protein [Candidatus Berkelbacteria bacterium]